MLSFESDYTEGAHEAILHRLMETNLEQTPGYGLDKYSESAKDRIREAFGIPEAKVFFLVGGTQTNSTVIASMLHDYHGVVAVETGHIGVHESGAVEFTGHKVLTLPHHDGKMTAEDLRAYLEAFYADGTYEHMVIPGMVYISFPTEFGTIYSKTELAALHRVCKDYSLPLFVDGARLGYGLMSEANDIDPKELPELCDVFYVGGTKVGALFGEAVVFTGGNAPAHFFTTIKQHGALMAKGRLLGLQFDTLFTDGLYFRIAAHADRMAALLKGIFLEKGYKIYIDSPTNQQFFVMSRQKAKELHGKVRFEDWCPVDEDNIAVRFVTSWATTEENVLALKEII
ncbi:MAG: low specificity L-threonine aldolase [Bacteroidales bacterium]|nr:low specificity L-threonine aldolase [Bacteroidales bacterium]MBQ6184746.1 low specificity L-threonine aldolase [Bacteroidales bacterium]